MNEMAPEMERPPKHVDLMTLWDLDRTLIKTGNLVDLVADYLKGKGQLDGDQVNALEETVAEIHRNEGTSVQPYAGMRQEFGLLEDPELLADDIIEQLGIDTVRERVLVEGVDGLFELLARKGVEKAIYTSAEDIIGQRFKIALLSRLVGQKDIPYWIVGLDPKASKIEKDWHDELTGEFDIGEPNNMMNGGWRAKRTALFDDKASNLSTDLPPEQLTAVLMNRDGKDTDGAYSIGQVRQVFETDGDLSALSFE